MLHLMNVLVSGVLRFQVPIVRLVHHPALGGCMSLQDIQPVCPSRRKARATWRSLGAEGFRSGPSRTLRRSFQRVPLLVILGLLCSACVTIQPVTPRSPASLSRQVLGAARSADLTGSRVLALSAHAGTRDPAWGCPGCGASGTSSDSPDTTSTRSTDPASSVTQEDLILSQTLLPFEITPAIRAFAERNSQHGTTPFQKINGILSAIYTLGKLEQQYESGRTATADETLKTLRGNCFAFTNLLVASARAIDIPAFFMDASSSARSTLRFDGERVVYAGHIVAGVETNIGLMTVDFYTLRRHTDTFWYRRLQDEEAVALYINNLGYDAMRQGQDPIPFFQAATRLAPQLESPWNNFATVLRTAGRMAEARAMLSSAVAQHPRSFAPYYNLALIEMQEGEWGRARTLFHQALLRRQDNAYLYYNLGIVYLHDGHRRAARLAMQQAVRLDGQLTAARSKLASLERQR